MRKWFLAAAAAALIMPACGYLQNVLSPSQDQTVIINPTPAPSATPTASPSPGASGLVRPASVRVGFFGGSCPSGSGKTFPSNGLGQVPVGCTGFATATPKHADGTDLTPAEHGTAIDWTLEPFTSAVNVLGVAEAFNKDVVGVSAGSFNLCATVQGVKGCLNGSVTP